MSQRLQPDDWHSRVKTNIEMFSRVKILGQKISYPVENFDLRKTLFSFMTKKKNSEEKLMFMMITNVFLVPIILQ